MAHKNPARHPVFIDRVCISSSPWLTLDQAARNLGVCHRVLLQRLNRLEQGGRAICCGSGKSVLIHSASLEHMIA